MVVKGAPKKKATEKKANTTVKKGQKVSKTKNVKVISTLRRQQPL